MWAATRVYVGSWAWSTCTVRHVAAVADESRQRRTRARVFICAGWGGAQSSSTCGLYSATQLKRYPASSSSWHQRLGKFPGTETSRFLLTVNVLNDCKPHLQMLVEKIQSKGLAVAQSHGTILQKLEKSMCCHHCRILSSYSAFLFGSTLLTPPPGCSQSTCCQVHPQAAEHSSHTNASHAKA